MQVKRRPDPVGKFASGGKANRFFNQGNQMLETQSYLPFAARRLAPPGGKGATGVRDTPSRNHLLAALPPETYARLLPHLEAVLLPRGWMVYGARDAETYLYFVTS